MAKNKATASIEEKLRSLYDLQLIDTKIDEIRSTQGELPKEVGILEDEIDEIQTRINNLNDEKQQLDTEIGKKKNSIQDSEAQIKRFKAQLDNVKNNREYEALSKEIEFQTLEIELSNKRINEYQAKIANKDEILEMANEKLAERSEDLKLKKSELDNIVVANEKTEGNLSKLSDDFGTKIEERLLTAYKRIRGNAKNGLAVVPVERGASGGSYIKIPPQRQLDIAACKKIIIDEHSGRILVDLSVA